MNNRLTKILTRCKDVIAQLTRDRLISEGARFKRADNMYLYTFEEEIKSSSKRELKKIFTSEGIDTQYLPQGEWTWTLNVFIKNVITNSIEQFLFSRSRDDSLKKSMGALAQLIADTFPDLDTTGEFASEKATQSEIKEQIIAWCKDFIIECQEKGIKSIDSDDVGTDFLTQFGILDEVEYDISEYTYLIDELIRILVIHLYNTKDQELKIHFWVNNFPDIASRIGDGDDETLHKQQERAFNQSLQRLFDGIYPYIKSAMLR